MRPNFAAASAMVTQAAEALTKGLYTSVAAFILANMPKVDQINMQEMAGTLNRAGMTMTALAEDSPVGTSLAEDFLARRQGINGVPYFVFNGRFGLSGAQEPEALYHMFDLAREDDALVRV